MKNKPLHHRIRFALNGIRLGFGSERSFRFQLMAGIGVIALLGLIQPPLLWWAVLIIMVGLVLFAELVNTALELLCDYVQPEYHEQIKWIKDIAAGAVLLLSVSAVIVGFLFFLDVFVDS